MIQKRWYIIQEIILFVAQPHKTLVLNIEASGITAALFSGDYNKRVLAWYEAPLALVYQVDGAVMHPSGLYAFMGQCIKDVPYQSIAVNVLFSSAVLAVDTYITTSSSVADIATFKKVIPAGVDWDFMYVGALDDGLHLFYVHGIHPAVLCAWRIALSKKPFSVQMIIPKAIALFETYKRMHGQGFRRAALALALQRAEYRNDLFFMQIKESPIFADYALQALGPFNDVFGMTNLAIVSMVPTVLF